MKNSWDSPETFLHHMRGGIGNLPGLIQFFSARREDKALEEKTLRLLNQSLSQGLKFIDAYTEILRPITLEKTKISPDSWLKEIVAAHPIAKAKNISIQGKLAGTNSPTLSIDTHWLKRAIDELLSNAKESMEQGGTLTLELSEDLPSSSVIISIKDSGIGMPPHAQEHCFEPFFTLKIDHLGMGLSWVEKITLAHGGELSILSSKGSGTQALLKLPR